MNRRSDGLSGYLALGGPCVSDALSLNNKHATELSFQTSDRFKHLIKKSFYAKWDPAALVFLIAFDETANYQNANFQWFLKRYPRFVYIDRVVVDPGRRRQGFASGIYRDLLVETQRSGRSIVCVEINLIPPNSASDAFHDKFGRALRRAWVKVQRSCRPSGNSMRRESLTLTLGFGKRALRRGSIPTRCLSSLESYHQPSRLN